MDSHYAKPTERDHGRCVGANLRGSAESGEFASPRFIRSPIWKSAKSERFELSSELRPKRFWKSSETFMASIESSKSCYPSR